jgi:hypothetical protein
MKKVIIIAVLTFVLAGCAKLASFNNWFNTNSDSVKTSIHLITDILLKGNPAKAAKWTVAIGKVQKQIPEGTLVPASLLADYINSQLKHTDLDAADLIVLADMTGPVQAKLLDTLTVLNLKDVPAQLVDVKLILGWVTDISSVIK